MRDVYSSGDRQLTVDVLRGYFILSMTSGHLVSEGLINGVLHVWRWVDGAAGFVCLSGFVLGLSQRGKSRRGEGAAAQQWILWRAAQIWAISVLLALGGFLLRVVRPELTFLEDIFRPERFGSALVDIAVLQLRAPYFGLLAMYVVYLLFAYLAVACLRRDRDYLVIGGSIAVYVASQLFVVPQLQMNGQQGAFTRSAWQLLFFMGLVAGWRWKDTLLPALRPWGSWITAAAAVVLAALLFLARGDDLPLLRDRHPGDLTAYFDKYNLSPPVVLYFAALIAVLPALVEQALRIPYADRVLRLVALIGRHSLANYILLCVVQAAAWLVLAPRDAHGGDHLAWMVIAVLLFLAYGFAVERGRAKRMLAFAAAPAPAAASASGPSARRG